MCRSVVLHLVRAGMVQTARAYGWTMPARPPEDGECPALLCPDWVLQCGRDRAEAHQYDRRFAAESVAHPSPWQASTGTSCWDTPPLSNRCGLGCRRHARCPMHPAPSAMPDRPALATLFRDHQAVTTTERNHRIALAHRDDGYALAAIGSALGLHYTTISKVVKAQGI